MAACPSNNQELVMAAPKSERKVQSRIETTPILAPIPAREVIETVQETLENVTETIETVQESIGAEARKVMEAGADGIREGLSEAEAAFSRNQVLVKEAVDALAGHVRAFQDKGLEAAKANGAAMLSYANALMQAKTLSDVIELQASHARKAMEDFVAQGRDFAGLAQTSTADLVARAKAMLPRAA
jgi:hypothetical protein